MTHFAQVDNMLTSQLIVGVVEVHLGCGKSHLFGIGWGVLGWFSNVNM